MAIQILFKKRPDLGNPYFCSAITIGQLHCEINNLFLLILVKENPYIENYFKRNVPPYIFCLEKYLTFKHKHEGLHVAHRIFKILYYSIEFRKQHFSERDVLADKIAQIVLSADPSLIEYFSAFPFPCY